MLRVITIPSGPVFIFAVMNSEFILRRISDENLKDLIPLYRDAFRKRVSLSYLRKKYDTRIFGAQYIGYFAYLDDRPVAYYGVLPVMIAYRGVSILAAQSGDTMTHSAQRGKGLFTTLAKATYDLARTEGIRLIFGFPNESSFPGFMEKLNWEHAGNFNYYSVPVRTIPLSAIANRVYMKSFYQACAGAFLRLIFKHALLPESSVQTPVTAAVLRNNKLYSYKTYTPNHTLQLGKYAVWLKPDGALLVGDVEITTDPDVNDLLTRLKRLALLLGCRRIIFQFSPGTFWDLQLSGIMDPKQGLPVGFLDLGSGIKGEELKFCFGDMDTF